MKTVCWALLIVTGAELQEREYASPSVTKRGRGQGKKAVHPGFQAAWGYHAELYYDRIQKAHFS